MRVANWRAAEVFESIKNQAMDNANEIMDDVVIAAKRKNDSYDHPYSKDRAGGYKIKTVSFTPKTGKNKGALVTFQAKTWMGRQAGSLRETIRRVNKRGSGSVRVYAGNYKVYYARFVERGTYRSDAKPFLRPAFNAIKKDVVRRIKEGI